MVGDLVIKTKVMQKIDLFKSKNGWISNLDIYNTLKQLDADQTDVLYIHTSLSFGIPNLEIKKKALLQHLFAIIQSLHVKTIIFPTYTFSFCNGQDFDLQNSKTSMGVLNDYVRQQSGAIRSVDPLMSNVLLGEETALVTNIGTHSCGENSTFDLLHKTSKKVKFLFLGTLIGDCFTYMHYIEDRVRAPYRYNKKYSGKIINNGVETVVDYDLIVRYGNVFPGTGSYIYENILIERGIAKKVKVGDSSISIVDEPKAYETYVELITRYPNFFIKDVFNESEKTPHIPVENMISL